jgi:hypothetical protein
MIDFKVNRQQTLDFLVEHILDNYHEDLFIDGNGGWLYRDRIKVTMFEAVIYNDAEEEGLKDITRAEMLWVKNEVLKKVNEKAS